MIGKHPSGMWGCAAERETVENVIFNCIKYVETREKWTKKLKEIVGGGIHVKN